MDENEIVENEIIPDEVVQTDVPQSDSTVGNLVDGGKNLLTKLGGKGLLGAAAGVIASKLLFKNSMFMTIASAGVGFVAERVIFGNKKSAEIPVINGTEIKPNPSVIAEPSAEIAPVTKSSALDSYLAESENRFANTKLSIDTNKNNNSELEITG